MLQSLQAVDREVLDLVCDLSARGVLDRTVIVFASDNGFLLGEHDLTQKAWPNEEAIRSCSWRASRGPRAGPPTTTSS